MLQRSVQALTWRGLHLYSLRNQLILQWLLIDRCQNRFCRLSSRRTCFSPQSNLSMKSTVRSSMLLWFLGVNARNTPFLMCKQTPTQNRARQADAETQRQKLRNSSIFVDFGEVARRRIMQTVSWKMQTDQRRPTPDHSSYARINATSTKHTF